MHLRQGVVDSDQTPQAVAFYSQAAGAGLKVLERAVAGFAVTDLSHSDMLGDAWRNVFVLTAKAI